MTDSGVWMQLGATCHAKVTDDVTHVVASAMDTDKMHWAKRHTRHRVSVNWLYVSGMNLASCTICQEPCPATSPEGFLVAIPCVNCI